MFVQTKWVDRLCSSLPLSFAAVVENGFFHFHLGKTEEQSCNTGNFNTYFALLVMVILLR